MEKAGCCGPCRHKVSRLLVGRRFDESCKLCRGSLRQGNDSPRASLGALLQPCTPFPALRSGEVVRLHRAYIERLQLTHTKPGRCGSEVQRKMLAVSCPYLPEALLLEERSYLLPREDAPLRGPLCQTGDERGGVPGDYSLPGSFFEHDLQAPKRVIDRRGRELAVSKR